MLTLARQQQRQNFRWLLCLSVLMLLALLLSLCAGELWILPGDWFSPRGELFVWQIRLPRTLAVLLVGAALVPLLIFTSDGKLMGDLVNSKRVKQTGWVIMVLVVALNIWLLVGTALGL